MLNAEQSVRLEVIKAIAPHFPPAAVRRIGSPVLIEAADVISCFILGDTHDEESTDKPETEPAKEPTKEPVDEKEAAPVQDKQTESKSKKKT